MGKTLLIEIFLKDSFVVVVVYPWYVFRKTIVWRVHKYFKCLFDLICSAFKAYYLKAILGPKTTLAKMITTGFVGVFSQTIFHVLETDANNYKPPSPKKKTEAH